ncbi:transposase [mine drainage metagenome]|uniref:Transposase n=1 Tax=mine drainage metagenome TaxID=410659 RepID=T1BSJ6_9ZZZZ
MREIAARVHTMPDGNQVMVSRPTVDRWLRAYRKDGLPGLQPQRRSDQGAIRRHPELFAEAADLRRELPARSAAHIADILKAKHGIEVAPRTIRDQLRGRGCSGAPWETLPLCTGGTRPHTPTSVGSATC